MSKQKPLTPYQQSLLAPKPITPKKLVFRCVQTSFVALIAYGYVNEFWGTLPGYLTGWLTFSMLVLVLAQWVGVLCSVLIRVTVGVIASILDNEDGEFESKKVQGGARKLLLMFYTKSNIINVYDLRNLWTWLDIAADWFLFFMLVTTNHTTFALFFISAVCLLYIIGNGIKNSLKESVRYIDDPLEADGKVDIDKLADRLFNGTDKKEGK